MVTSGFDARWSGVVFRVVCSCGLRAACRVGVSPQVAELRGWATFASLADEGGCQGCRDAVALWRAGQWPRAERRGRVEASLRRLVRGVLA